MASVLISVRNVEEAKVALQAGVDLIDLKDPEKAAMGMMDLSLISQIQNELPKDLNLSMACGELCDIQNLPKSLPAAMSFYKFGLSACKNIGNWVENWLSLKAQVQLLNPSAFIVPVLYGDYLKANSTKPFDILEILCDHSCHAVMIDTWEKNGSSIIDWITVEELLEIQNKCKAQNIKFALAGSLNLEKVIRLVKEGVRPEWFGFRGAACKDQSRNKTIDFHLTSGLIAGVKRLNNLVAS
ncbi:MAG: hypothetical protein EBT92_10600 [Planctomycetes bacterium]|nr:hypothetical protein [Planctomycetota bacterium]